MKAAVLHRPEHLTLEEIPVPEIADDEVLIKLKACGVCGTDVLAYHGGHPRITYPRVLGHEFSGVVCRVGKKVNRVAVGMRVTSTMEIQCGEAGTPPWPFEPLSDRKSIGLCRWGWLSI
jgi:D-arabinose 1-dehydrogenase-like Zn-dependent alcohol dehydrogenase